MENTVDLEREIRGRGKLNIQSPAGIHPIGSWSNRLDWRDGHVEPVSAWVPEDLYSDILEWMPICCVDTVIVNEGRMFQTLRSQEPQAGQWWVQGGRLRKGENLLEAAKRTADAETGLDVELVELLGVFSTMFDSSAHANSTTHTVNITFLGALTAANADPAIDVTHTDYRWWPLSEPTGNPYLDQLGTLARTALSKANDQGPGSGT